MTTNVSGEGGVIERAHRGQSVADWHWIGSLHDQSRPNPASQCALDRHGACVLVAVGLRYRKWWLGILFWYTDVTRFG